VSDLAHEWETSSYPVQMLHLYPPGPGRKGRLLLVACCRLCGERLAEGSRRAVEVGERWADGLATVGEFKKARLAADVAAQLRHQSEHRTYSLAAAMTAHATVFGEPGPDDFSRAVQLLRPAFAAGLLRDIFGSSIRPVSFAPEWRTDTVLALARQMYESREFGAMPILADALQDAGCDNDDILNHCRDATRPHVRGCWVVDLVLDKR
jgi:hypothetical protein